MRKRAPMTVAEAGRIGVVITNSKLTRESRIAAAKKGWRNRRKKLKEQQ